MIEPGTPVKDAKKLRKSVSYELSENEDYNSVTGSDAAGYVSVAVPEYSAVPTHSINEKKHDEIDDTKSVAESLNNNNNSKNADAELTSFVQKKSFAQNMMDIALLSANTNQLRYVFDLGDKHPYYSTSLFLIILSLVMQVVVGLSMLYMSRFNMKNRTEMKQASHVNNLSVAGVFLVTLVNVFISTFNGAGSGGTIGPSLNPVPGTTGNETDSIVQLYP